MRKAGGLAITDRRGAYNPRHARALPRAEHSILSTLTFRFNFTEEYAGSPRLQSREECEKCLLCLRRIMTSWQPLPKIPVFF